jgi:hypothetical protein
MFPTLHLYSFPGARATFIGEVDICSVEWTAPIADARAHLVVLQSFTHIVI